MSASGPFIRCAMVLVVAIAAAGCRSVHVASLKVPYDSAASLYDRARITYEIDAGKLQVPVSVARVEGQLVYYQQIPSSTRAQSSLGKLEIQYPHPRGLDGYALARVRIESRYPDAPPEPKSDDPSLAERISATARDMPLVGPMVKPTLAVEEVWELDVPRNQIDRIVFELNRSGYFRRDAKNEGPVAIAARVDGYPVEHKWQRVEELDALMVEVRTHGRLLSYQRSESSEKMSQPPPESVAAYRAYAAHDVQVALSGARFAAAGYAYPGVSASPASGIAAALGDPRALVARASATAARVSRLPAVELAPTVR